MGTSRGGRGADEATVLVVDRRRAFAQALAARLSERGFPATSAPCDQAVAVIGRLRPVALLVDGDPPRESAIELAGAARAECDDGRVLVLVDALGRARGRAVADVGADAAVSRHGGLDEVVAALRGETCRTRTAQAYSARSQAPRNPLDRLTPRERQVLQAMMTGGRSAVIADALGISPHTMRTHVQNTLAKLAVSTRLEAASVARAAGLRPLSPEEAAGVAGPGP